MIASLVPIIAMAQTAPSRVIDKGTRSQITAPREVVVRTDAEWEALWREHQPARPREPIDFSKEIVVGVFLGSRPTPGYGVTIDNVATVRVNRAGGPADSGETTISYRETKPAPDAITAQVITFPYQIIAIAKSGAKITFKKIQ